LSDVNFDPLFDRFKKNIYQSYKGQIRQAVLEQSLSRYLPELRSEKPLDCADVGGGLGQITLALAQLGHRVDYFDLSEKMAAHAQAEVVNAGIGQQVKIKQGPFQHHFQPGSQLIAQPDLQPDSQPGLESKYDIIVAQALLEWLADPWQGLNLLLQGVKPKGVLALMFYNRHSIQLKNLIKGNFYKAESDDFAGDGKSLTPMHPLNPESVYQHLQNAGFDIRAKVGVRTFSEHLFPHVPLQERIPDMIRLEKQFCEQEPYVSMGRYILVLAERK